MLSKIQAEPALATAFVAAMISLVTAFGLHLDATQIGGLMAVTAAVLGFVTRSLVTPVAALQDVPTV